MALPLKAQSNMNAPFDPTFLMNEKFAVGQPVSRKEDPVLLRGEGRYTDRAGVETEIDPLLDEYWYDAPETAKAARAKLLAGLG